MALFGRQNKCVNCKKELPVNANFCPYCGAAQPGGRGKCPKCGSVVASDANFCPHCHHQLGDSAGPSMEGRRWAKGPDDFAARVEVEDVPGFFRKDVVVEPGTRALMLVDGKNIAGELGPGKYTLKTANLFSAKTATAILVDSGDTDLEFTISDLFTSDPLRITMDCRLVARVDNVVMFLTNMMKGQRTFPLSRLRQYLFDEIQNAASEAVGRHSVEELNSNLALKEELAMDIEAHLNRTFQRMGLRFDRVRTLNFRHEHWDEVLGAKADLFLQISKEEALAQGRRRLADVLHEKELQEIIEETRKVERYEQRANVWARMRRAVASDRMDEVRTEEDFSSFMRGIDRQRLIEESELEELKREFRERKEDHDLARAHFLTRTRLEQDYELRMLELTKRRDLTLDQLRLEQEIERRRVEGKLEIGERQFATELDRRRREAQLQAELEELERKGDEADAELGLRLLREMKAIRREEAERAQELQLQAEERRLEMELRRFREEREADLARIQTLSQLSTEALIAVSGPEQGRLLAELKKTEAMKGMSEEQILALAAEKSPEVARAFQEKFRGLSTEEQKTMYERLVQAERASKDEQAKLWRDTMQTLERMFEKAVQTQAETATAFARGQQAPTVIVTPGGGPTVVGGGAAEGSGRMLVCRNCGAESPVGTKYCKNCGEAFYD
ncbi:MAG: zinc-ribbon domain-containing protein [Anaerolineae bacterium]|nr:zinc-ribbon domain-containing protein [Anaerolineae bacterium]